MVKNTYRAKVTGGKKWKYIQTPKFSVMIEFLLTGVEPWSLSSPETQPLGYALALQKHRYSLNAKEWVWQQPTQ